MPVSFWLLVYLHLLSWFEFYLVFATIGCMDSIPCNLVLLPDQRLTDKAINLSRELARFDSYFVLEEGKRFAHISLYKFQLKAEDIPKVDEALASIARSVSPLQLKARTYSYEHDGYHFIDVEYEKTAELLGLQKSVIEAVNPLREGMREKDKERMLSAEGLSLENYQKYGYNLVGELFRPHISLTRLKTEDHDVSKVLDDLHDFDGSFVALGLFETGDHGTAIRKLTEPQLFRA